MGKQKTPYARYTFAFAADIQKLADEKHIVVDAFRTSQRKSKRGSYDYLTVSFVVPRPDRDVVETTEKPLNLETTISELEEELEKDNEVNTNDI